MRVAKQVHGWTSGNPASSRHRYRCRWWRRDRVEAIVSTARYQHHQEHSWRNFNIQPKFDVFNDLNRSPVTAVLGLNYGTVAYSSRRWSSIHAPCKSGRTYGSDLSLAQASNVLAPRARLGWPMRGGESHAR